MQGSSSCGVLRAHSAGPSSTNVSCCHPPVPLSLRAAGEDAEAVEGTGVEGE